MNARRFTNSPFIVGSGWHVVIFNSIEFSVRHVHFTNFDKVVIPAECFARLNAGDEFGTGDKEKDACNYLWI